MRGIAASSLDDLPAMRMPAGYAALIEGSGRVQAGSGLAMANVCSGWRDGGAVVALGTVTGSALAGTRGCTHLTDVLRFLRHVPALTSWADYRQP